MIGWPTSCGDWGQVKMVEVIKMAFTTLISVVELAAHLADANWAVVDCRFALNDPAKGHADYLQAHIPGAVYADLNNDLSGPVTPGVTGRHPLPDVAQFAARLGAWGINDQTQVVAYDSNGGAIGAARLWWMLRWLGHDAVAVLDGGWQAWVAENRPTTNGTETREARQFTPRPRPNMQVDADEVARLASDPAALVIDSRNADRYRGENESIDPVAGHIAGAANLPYASAFDANGFFLPADQLRARFVPVFGERPAEQVVFYCGSGVSAANNVLAVAHSGLGTPRLYPGSWSEWITRKDRPVATGQQK